ncbi:hypothetical protein RAD16_36315 [Bradyrhizobium sp. 18BD]
MKLHAIFLPLAVDRRDADFGPASNHREIQYASRRSALFAAGWCIVAESFDTADQSIAALEEMHSRIKPMIATAIGRRGKWRTLWRGATTRPGQP